MTNASTASRQTPVDTQTWMQAVDAGDAARVQSLLAAGADVNATSSGGKTALMRATSRGRADIVRILLDAGADVSAQKENGATSLVMAVFFGHADIVRALLEAGADSNAQTPQGTPVREWALNAGFDEIAELLSNADAFRAESARTRSEPVRELEFFPAAGPFNSVIPLSEIDATTSFVGVVPSNETFTAGIKTRAARRAENSEPEPDEQDEPTVVPPRVRSTPSSHASFAARRRRGLRSWPVTALSLALILIAAALADAVWKNSKQATATGQSEPIAASAPASDDVQAQTAQSQLSTDGIDASNAQPAPTISETDSSTSSTARESVALTRPHASSSSVTDEADPKVKKSDKSDASSSSSSISVAVVENRRASEAATPARGKAAADARARQTAVTAGTERNSGGSPRPVTVRPEARAARRAQINGRGPTSSSKEAALSVVAPAPSTQPGKKDVIQWP